MVARFTKEKKGTRALLTRGPILPTSPAVQYFPYVDLSSPIAEVLQRLPDAWPDLNNDTFDVKVWGKKQIFARDIDSEEFDNALQNVLTVEEPHMRCYRAFFGSKNAREWKPLEDEGQFNSMVISYKDVGVEVGLQEKVK